MAARAFLARVGIDVPIIQAPMAGTSTPVLAAAVSNAGGLGSLALGALSPDAARAQLAELRRLTARPIHANVFVHGRARVRPDVEDAWLAALHPIFETHGASPPTELRTIYKSFAEDDVMANVLVDARPEVVSFHFGLPPRAAVDRLRPAVLVASVTSVAEARAAVDAGMDAVVAQGHEAGGHRGIFDPHAHDERLAALDLLDRIRRELDVPVVVAGGVMKGSDVRRALEQGAAAVQCGTAFVACPESAADEHYRRAIAALSTSSPNITDGSQRGGTVMTSAISGRPARSIKNRFTAWEADVGSKLEYPDYPRAYDAGKLVNAAAKVQGEGGYGAQWAGTGVGRSRAMPAGALVRLLWDEAGGRLP
ncbi:hypothetical protein Q5752_000127 [Cryptotrichosporon argae]